MPARKNDTIYRVLYAKKGSPLCEIHARSVGQSDMLGFIEVSDFVQPKTNSRIIRPDQDRAAQEFEGVTRTFIPLTDIHRIDAIPATALKVESSPLRILELHSAEPAGRA